MNDAVKQFFQFMVKRESLRLKKEAGEPWPWSDDAILNTYKFTNVKREHDRTTRWMRENWTTPNKDRPNGEILFNCALYRYFGTAEFAAAIGWQSAWCPQKIETIAKERMSNKQRVFTGAYIIPTLGVKRPKSEVVCREILTPLWARRDVIAEIANSTKSWRLTAEELRKMPGFGGTGFMTKETLQDAMQTKVLKDAIDKNTWCPAGPGARRGLNRLYRRPLNKQCPEGQLLEEMILLFESAPEHLPDFMPELELHDIQFQLCEFDKYERVRLGEGRPRSKYQSPSTDLFR